MFGRRTEKRNPNIVQGSPSKVASYSWVPTILPLLEIQKREKEAPCMISKDTFCFGRKPQSTGACIKPKLKDEIIIDGIDVDSIAQS